MLYFRPMAIVNSNRLTAQPKAELLHLPLNALPKYAENRMGPISDSDAGDFRASEKRETERQ